MFPKDFLWGAATSSHQVEGENIHNDWWPWELRNKKVEASGKACNHYELFKEDFDLAKQLGHNAHRFSIEWSRIEPEENRFDENAINHYRMVIDELLKRNIIPIVTLHHFTNPKWFFDKGGWLNKEAPDYFERYVEKIVSALGDKINYWITINEPMVLVHASYIIGVWPTEQKSLSKAWKANVNLISAHKKAYEKIHEIYKNNNFAKPMVSISKNFHLFKACNLGIKPLNNLVSNLRNKFFNLYFFEKIQKFMDFIGLNYYTRDYVSFSLSNYRELFAWDCTSIHNHSTSRNSLGWSIYPKGLLEVLKIIKKFDLPIFITENGICTNDDKQRWQFIREHIEQLDIALKEGIPIIGYLYWSLMDNFEWEKGFSPRFGLIEIDYATFKRNVRESARKYGEFIKSLNNE